MSRRDKPYKPSEASRDYVIFGTKASSSFKRSLPKRDTSQDTLNNVTRRRTASQRGARKAQLEGEIKASLRQRYVMSPIRQQDRGSHPPYEPEEES